MRNPTSLAWASFLPFALLASPACSGALAPSGASGDAGTTSDGASDRTPPPPVDAGPPLSGPGTPPPPPPAPPGASTPTRTFAVSKFLLGDTTRDGVASTTAWKAYGYNLDGKISDKNSTDTCRLAAGAGKENQVDGTGGIDNAWGSRILPIFQTFTHDLSIQSTQAIQGGAYTYLIETVGLTDDAQQTNTNVPGQIFLGAPFGGKPTFTKADDWPALTSTLANGQLSGGAKTQLAGSYINLGTWVGAPRTDVTFRLLLGAVPIDLVIHHATVSFDHAAPSKALRGTIAGTLTTEEFVASLKAAAGAITSSLCGGSGFDSLAAQIRQGADMLSDGTNSAGIPCDAISIGLGFEADEVSNVTRVTADPPPPNPCP